MPLQAKTFPRTISYPSFILLTSTCLWRWNRQCVPKRWHIKSRGRVITQRKHTTTGWRLLLFLVLYLWISLLGVNKCLLSTVNNITEYIYWEYSVIICMFLKISLQESLGLVFVIILMIFFWSKITFLAHEELPQKITPQLKIVWMWAKYIIFNVSIGNEYFIYLKA